MMYSSPYFHSPFFPPMYQRYVPKYRFPQGKINVAASLVEQKEETNTIETSITRPQEESTQKENRSCEDKPIFEILGIKLFFDDLLILGLLFFLYSEGVKDQELFFALILLLFS